MNSQAVTELLQDTYLTEMFFARCDDAITEVDKKYHGLLFSVIYTILKNVRDTEECLNDVYMKLWGSIPPNRPLSFRAYAVKIARNTAITAFRRNTAEKRASTIIVESFEDLDEIASEDNCYDDRSLKIREIINSYLLSADERKTYIFMSRYYFKKPIREISKKLGCSESTVNKEIKKIKTELKEKLEEGGIYL